jgi:hypothetical protein
VYGTTNLAQPISTWTRLGAATEVSPGQFQFTNSTISGGPLQFYRVSSP